MKIGLLPAALSLGSVVILLVSTSRMGLGLTPDSANYISTARSLLDGGGYSTFYGQPFIHGGPLFSTVLAFLGLTGFDPLDLARYVNAIAFGLIIFASGYWLIENVKSRIFVLLGSIAIVLSPPVVLMSTMASTEPLFILLVLLSLFSIQAFSRKGTPRSLFLSALFAGLATLTRYPGVTVSLACLILVVARKDVPYTARFRHAAIFAFISITPILVWLARNYVVSGNLVGGPPPGVDGPPPSVEIVQHNTFTTLDTISAWFIPDVVPAIPQLLTVVLVFTAIGSLLLWANRTQKTQPEGVDFSRITPLIYFISIYTGYLIVQATIVAFDLIGNRLLSPIYVPIILVIVFGLANVSDSLARRFFGHLRTIVVVGVLIWLVLPGLRTGHIVVDAFQSGIGYASEAWQGPQGLIAYIGENPLVGQVYSNHPEGIYLLADVSVKMSPRVHKFRSPNTPGDDLDQFNRSLPSDKDIYLVWFRAPSWAHLYPPSQLRTTLDLEVIANMSDGTVYRVNPRFSD